MFLLDWVCVINDTSLKLMYLQESLRDCIINSVNIDDISPGTYHGTRVCAMITHVKMPSWHYFIFASFTDRDPARKISAAQAALYLFGNGLPIHSILNFWLVLCMLSLILCETPLTDVSAFARLFCSSYSVVRIFLLESLDSLLWDLKVLYQFHS